MLYLLFPQRLMRNVCHYLVHANPWIFEVKMNTQEANQKPQMEEYEYHMCCYRPQCCFTRGLDSLARPRVCCLVMLERHWDKVSHNEYSSCRLDWTVEWTFDCTKFVKLHIFMNMKRVLLPPLRFQLKVSCLRTILLKMEKWSWRLWPENLCSHYDHHHHSPPNGTQTIFEIHSNYIHIRVCHATDDYSRARSLGQTVLSAQ